MKLSLSVSPSGTLSDSCFFLTRSLRLCPEPWPVLLPPVKFAGRTTPPIDSLHPRDHKLLNSIQDPALGAAELHPTGIADLAAMAFSPSAPLGAILLDFLLPARVGCSVEGRAGPFLPHSRLLPTESPARPRRGAAAPPPPWRHAGACRHSGAQARPAWLREGLLPHRLPSSLTASKRGRSGGRRGQPPRARE